MSKQQEDTMHEIYEEVERQGLRKKFNAQLQKMKKQPQHQYKTVCEGWEYALRKIKNK